MGAGDLNLGPCVCPASGLAQLVISPTLLYYKPSGQKKKYLKIKLSSFLTLVAQSFHPSTWETGGRGIAKNSGQPGLCGEFQARHSKICLRTPPHTQIKKLSGCGHGVCDIQVCVMHMRYPQLRSLWNTCWHQSPRHKALPHMYSFHLDMPKWYHSSKSPTVPLYTRSTCAPLYTPTLWCCSPPGVSIPMVHGSLSHGLPKT